MLNSLRERYGLILSVLILCFIVYALTISALWLGDDIIYRYHIATGEEISSVVDAFTSQVRHYEVMNGRFPAHFLVQISIALLGQPLFSILNSVMYVALLLILLRILGISLKDNLYVLFVALLLLISFPTKFVPSCQIGYIWMFTIVLCYIYLFFRTAEVKSIWNALWLCPFSLLAGWSQESLVIGVSVALIIYVISNLKQLTINQWVMFISFGIGAMLLCFSPGTLSRTGEIHGSVDFLPPVVYSLIKLSFYLRVTYLLMGYVLYLRFIKRKSLNELYSLGPFYVHTLIALFLFNALIGVFGNRQLFGIELMSMILLIKYVKEYSETCLFRLSLLFITSITVLVVFFNDCMFLKHERNIYDEICSQYLSSDNGIVYYDFNASDVTFYETYPSDVFTQNVLSTLNRYLTTTYEKQFELSVLPTVCRNLDMSNSCVNNAKGAYSIIIDKSCNPDKIIQKRKIEVGSLSKIFKDRDITNNAPIYEDDEYRVIQLYDKFPLVKTETIIFE